MAPVVYERMTIAEWSALSPLEQRTLLCAIHLDDLSLLHRLEMRLKDVARRRMWPPTLGDYIRMKQEGEL